MGRPKGSVNKPPEASENGAVATVAVTPSEGTITMTRSELKALIAEEVQRGIADSNTVKNIDDTGYWQATCKCQGEIFGCIEADRIIFLDEEKEKALQLGKYEDSNRDKRYPRIFKKPSQYDLQRAIRDGEVNPEEGLAVLPPLTRNDSLDPERQPFALNRPAPGS